MPNNKNKRVRKHRAKLVARNWVETRKNALSCGVESGFIGPMSCEDLKTASAALLKMSEYLSEHESNYTEQIVRGLAVKYADERLDEIKSKLPVFKQLNILAMKEMLALRLVSSLPHNLEAQLRVEMADVQMARLIANGAILEWSKKL